MKSTGIVRKIDELGRVVIPMEIRNTMGINSRDAMEIFVDGDKIILRKYGTSCVFCGGEEDVTLFRGKMVCHDCIEQMKKQF